MSAITTQPNDPALLTRFVREGCESSFAELVATHQGLVLGTALRRTGNVEMARDVAQQVFVLLARKAAWLVGRESITGWLHHAASFLAARAVRCESRARARHAELAKETEARIPDTKCWAALEDALDALGTTEREALLQHYFEDRSYPEMASQLGLSEAAVRKRVSRAMQSLGERLRQRGITVPTTALLAGAIAMQLSVPAQAGLATATLTAGGTATPTLLTFTTVMSHTAAKIAAAAILLTAVPVAVTYQANSRLRAETAESARSATGTASAHDTSSGTRENADLAAQNREVLDVWNQLAAEQTRRKLAEEKVTDLTKQIERARTEVVISLGQVEDVARRVADYTRTMKEFERLMDKADATEKEKIAREFALKMSSGLPDLSAIGGEMPKIESAPEKAGRFYATLIGEIAELDPAQRDAIAKVATSRFDSMRQLGLTAAQRPTKDDSVWTEARARALTNLQDAILAAMPEDKRKREIFSSDLMEIATGAWMSNSTSSGGAK